MLLPLQRLISCTIKVYKSYWSNVCVAACGRRALAVRCERQRLYGMVATTVCGMVLVVDFIW